MRPVVATHWAMQPAMPVTSQAAVDPATLGSGILLLVSLPGSEVTMTKVLW